MVKTNRRRRGMGDSPAYVDLGNGYIYDPSDDTVFDPTVGDWVAYATFQGWDADDDTAAVATIQTAAASGWDIGALTQNLLSLGYTAAQLATLYQNVKTSQQATPQMLQLLAKENGYLQTNTQTSNTTWMIVGVGFVALVLLMGNRNQQ